MELGSRSPLFPCSTMLPFLPYYRLWLPVCSECICYVFLFNCSPSEPFKLLQFSPFLVRSGARCPHSPTFCYSGDQDHPGFWMMRVAFSMARCWAKSKSTEKLHSNWATTKQSVECPCQCGNQTGFGACTGGRRGCPFSPSVCCKSSYPLSLSSLWLFS